MDQLELMNELINAEATLITSSWESGPMTFYESLGMGTPVLITDIDAVSVFKFEKCKTPLDLKNMIVKLLHNENFRQELLYEQISEVNKYLESTSFATCIYD